MSAHQPPASRRSTGPITLKLILVLLLIALPPMIGTAYYNLVGSVQRVSLQEQGNQRLLAESTAERLDQLIGNVQKVVRMLAADQEVISFLQARGKHRQAFQRSTQRSLDTIKSTVGLFESVYLMDDTGVFVAATNHKVVGRRFDFRAYYQHARAGNFFVSELIFGSTSHKPGLYFSGPVRNDAGEIIGVVVIKLDASALADILGAISHDRRVTPFVVDADGVVIFHPDDKVRYHTLTRLPPKRMEAIQAKKRFPVPTLASLDLPSLAAALDKGERAGSTRFTGRDDTPQVAGYAHMRTHPWTVVISEPEARFAEPLNELFQRTMYSVSLVALLVILVAMLSGRAILRPVMRLINAARLMERGDYKRRQGPFDVASLGLAEVTAKRDEVGELARVFETMSIEVAQREEQLETEVQARTRELWEKNRELEAAHHRISEELRVAQALQLSILPHAFPQRPDLDLHAVMHPAREVGGDFYDFFFIDPRRVAVVVADVSGKGVPAAFFMAVSRTELQTIARNEPAPGKVLREVNERLCAENPLSLFVTVFYGVLDLGSGRFVYANGGHNPPLLLSAAGQPSWLATTDGTALGVMEGLEYDEAEITLGAGDAILLYTDGVTEAFDRAGVAYGEERLLARVTGTRGEAAELLTAAVVADVGSFTAGAEVSDDITCLALRYDSVPKQQVTVDLSSDTADLERLREALEEFAAGASIDEAEVMPLNLCLEEAVSNSMLYGEGDTPIAIRVTLAREDDTFIAIIEDNGRPFDPLTEAVEPDLDAMLEERAVGGLGVHLITSMMDTVEYQRTDERNRLELRKKLGTNQS